MPPPCNGFQNFGAFSPHASQFWAKQTPDAIGPVAQSLAFPKGAYVLFSQCLGTLGPSTQALPVLSSAEAYGGNLSNQWSTSVPSLGMTTPGKGVLGQSRPGTPDPNLGFCLPGRPGLPRELGAAHHRPGARGGLHLLPEAAAAPDD